MSNLEQMRELVLGFAERSTTVKVGADVYEQDIVVWSEKTRSREKWQNMGEKLVQLLQENGFGFWTIIGCGRRSVTLLKPPE